MDKKGRRETNTMPQWAGSCWYYIRYIDPHNSEQICDPKLLDKWLPVDFICRWSRTCGITLIIFSFLA